MRKTYRYQSHRGKSNSSMLYTQMCVIKKSRQIQQQDYLLSNFRDAEYIGNQGGFIRGNLRNGKQHLVSNLG